MNKSYNSLGLMSGTSGDGVDASIIKSDGKDNYDIISDNYFGYTKEISQNIHYLREKIYEPQDLNKYLKELKKLENDITIFHVNVVEEVIKNLSDDIEFIGFHGQTIFHNSSLRKTIQLGDANLLSKLTKKKSYI